MFHIYRDQQFTITTNLCSPSGQQGSIECIFTMMGRHELDKRLNIEHNHPDHKQLLHDIIHDIKGLVNDDDAPVNRQHAIQLIYDTPWLYTHIIDTYIKGLYGVLEKNL